MLVNLTIKTIDRRIFSISIDDSLTIYDVKCELMNKYDIGIQEQKLLLKGRMINNDSSIASLNISKDDIFILFIFTKKNPSHNETITSTPTPTPQTSVSRTLEISPTSNINNPINNTDINECDVEITSSTDNNNTSNEITYFRESSEIALQTYPSINESPNNPNIDNDVSDDDRNTPKSGAYNIEDELLNDDNDDDEFECDIDFTIDYNSEENKSETDIDFPSLSDTEDDDIYTSQETIHNNTPNNDIDIINNTYDDNIGSPTNTLSAVISTLRNDSQTANTTQSSQELPNNPESTESLLSIILSISEKLSN